MVESKIVVKDGKEFLQRDGELLPVRVRGEAGKIKYVAPDAPAAAKAQTIESKIVGNVPGNIAAQAGKGMVIIQNPQNPSSYTEISRQELSRRVAAEQAKRAEAAKTTRTPEDILKASVKEQQVAQVQQQPTTREEFITSLLRRQKKEVSTTARGDILATDPRTGRQTVVSTGGQVVTAPKGAKISPDVFESTVSKRAKRTSVRIKEEQARSQAQLKREAELQKDRALRQEIGIVGTRDSRLSKAQAERIIYEGIRQGTYGDYRKRVSGFDVLDRAASPRGLPRRYPEAPKGQKVIGEKGFFSQYVRELGKTVSGVGKGVVVGTGKLLYAPSFPGFRKKPTFELGQSKIFKTDKLLFDKDVQIALGVAALTTVGATKIGAPVIKYAFRGAAGFAGFKFLKEPTAERAATTTFYLLPDVARLGMKGVKGITSRVATRTTVRGGVKVRDILVRAGKQPRTFEFVSKSGKTQVRAAIIPKDYIPPKTLGTTPMVFPKGRDIVPYKYPAQSAFAPVLPLYQPPNYFKLKDAEAIRIAREQTVREIVKGDIKLLPTARSSIRKAVRKSIRAGDFGVTTTPKQIPKEYQVKFSKPTSKDPVAQRKQEIKAEVYKDGKLQFTEYGKTRAEVDDAIARNIEQSRLLKKELAELKRAKSVGRALEPIGPFAKELPLAEPKSAKALRAKEAKFKIIERARRQTISEIIKGDIALFPTARKSIRKEIRRRIRREQFSKLLKKDKSLAPRGPFAQELPLYEPKELINLRVREEIVKELTSRKRSMLEARSKERRLARKFFKTQTGFPQPYRISPDLLLQKKKIGKPFEWLKESPKQKDRFKPTVKAREEFVEKKDEFGRVLLLKKPKQKATPKTRQEAMQKLKDELLNKQSIVVKQRKQQIAKYKSTPKQSAAVKQRDFTKQKLGRLQYRKPSKKVVPYAIPLKKEKVGVISEPKPKVAQLPKQKPSQEIISKVDIKTDIIPASGINIGKTFPRVPKRGTLEKYSRLDSSNLINRLKPPKQISVARLDWKPKGQYKRQQAFDVFIKRYGREIRIGKALPKGKALTLGSAEVKKTLAATFKLKPVGVTTQKDVPKKLVEDIYRRFRIVRGKKVYEPLTFIEKKEFRLSARSEVSEIQRARKRKRRI